MSFSSSKPLTFMGPATPRLYAAVAASLALHVLLAFVLDDLPRGMYRGELPVLRPGAAQLRIVLLRTAPEDPAPAPVVKPVPAGEVSASANAGEDTGVLSDVQPPPALLTLLHYYTTEQLDVRPWIMVRIEPEYPEAAARRFLSGTVVVQLFLDESGRVERVVAMRAEPRGYFEEAAERAFRAARFTPGIKDGRPVKVRMNLQVNFESAPPPG